MCGISGVFLNIKNKNSKGLEQAVERMNQSQFRRGPDDEGIFADARGGVVFGHRRLSILDLSKAGHQPMEFNLSTCDVDSGVDGNINSRDRLVITFNGEIYNFLELKKELEKKGYKFKTKTDTEVILALYAEYGEKSFSMLRGMFAFGLWDGKAKKLFLVKDRYGIKPLYYFSDAEKLVFASTVRAITESGLVAIQKNPQALIGFLLFGSVPLPMTTIKNVFAVPAGHYLVREADGGQKLVEYYDPLDFFNKGTSDASNIDGNYRTSDVQNIVSKIRDLLEESVNLHLISDAPLGVFLSGGLDSSAIAALARRSLGEGGLPLTTLSIVFDEPEFSEQKYQRLVAQKIKSDHREVKITQKDFFDSFGEIFEAMDQPTIDGVNGFFIAKAAKEAGLKTVLSGLGADEIFLGYPHFRRAATLRKIQSLPKFLKFPLKLASLMGDRYSKLNYFTNSDDLSFYLGIRGLFSPQETAKILDINLSEVKDFIINIGTSDVFRTSDVQKLDPVNLLSYLELKFYLQNQLLKDTDFMSMYHSIEVRVPFLDHPLVEYVSSLPAETKLNPKFENLKLKIKNSRLKPLLSAAVSDILPEEIFGRAKMGFTFPFEKWLSSDVSAKGGSASGGKGQMSNVKTHWSRHWAKEVLGKF